MFKHATVALVLLLAVLASVSLAVAEPDGKSLLGEHWEFSGQVPSDWRHKDNARLSIDADGPRQALRLESGFAPFTFTWATRNFAPRSVLDVVHLEFRVRGDGSGHRLHVTLGGQRADQKQPRYYQNFDQAVTLDFRGWRTITVDLEKFATPTNGLRPEDLAHVVFLQFFVTAQDAGRPLDVALADIRFSGRTPGELAAIEARRKERQRLIDATTPRLAAARLQLAGLAKTLDDEAQRGRDVAVARVYWAAWNWCAADVARCLEADEGEIVRQAPLFLEGLEKLVGQPQNLLGRVQDAPPPEEDRFTAAENPYFQSMIRVAQGFAKKESTWPKGRQGYESIPNAWTFAGMGNNVYDLVWSLGAPRSPLRHHPMLLAGALSRLDTIAHQHTAGDFNIDRTAIYGSDHNINRFCLAPTLDAWWQLRRAYPDLLPPAKQADLEAGLKRLADYQLTDYGLARLEQEPHVKFPAYPNMDVHHILIMEFAHRLWGDPQYARERDAFVKILDAAVYPDGGFAYINTQNECFVYHQLNVVYSARFWQLTQNPVTLAMLRRTKEFYPYNVEPAGMPEYYTDACWKHYWGGGHAAGPDVIAALCDDGRNKRVAEISGQLEGYGHGYVAGIAAEFWKPLPAVPLPDGYLRFDRNIDGPRGRFGPWSFAGNGRNYGVGYQGKDTFVGAMLTDAERRPLPLDAALQIVTSEVRLNLSERHWWGGRCHSAREQLTTTLGPDFGGLAVRYTVSKPNWHHRDDDLLPWEGTQAWYLSKTRLVGLVILEATADEDRAAVYGRVRLGLSRELEPDGPDAWRYGQLRVKIHAHNYGSIVTRPSETFYQDLPEKFRSTEITLVDPLSTKAEGKGNVRFAQGTQYWFLVEVFPAASQPAERVQRVEAGPLFGFTFAEADRQVTLWHNPTAAAATAPAPPDIDRSQTRVYQDTQGTATRATGPINVTGQSHAVVVAPRP